jgi:hypothetical protein
VVCSQNLCKAKPAEPTLRLQELRSSSAGKRIGRLCRLLGGGRVCGYSYNECTFEWSQFGVGVMGERGEDWREERVESKES